jgi:hypothetical protein
MGANPVTVAPLGRRGIRETFQSGGQRGGIQKTIHSQGRVLSVRLAILGIRAERDKAVRLIWKRCLLFDHRQAGVSFENAQKGEKNQ